jgi:DNA-binding CsgD family transcriptional regulator/tetratricopeptide (TPR) repeat protein
MIGELVGRRREVALIERAAAEATRGLAQLVIVGGAAGVGKTRLLEHSAARLPELRVLRGGCVELCREGVPLAPVTSALRDLLRQVGRERLGALLPNPAPVLGLLPELRLPRPDSQVRPCELFGGLLRALAAEQPVLLIIDDLQWADRSTRDLLGYLARTLAGSRVLVATAYRSDQLPPGDPLPGFLAELSRLPGVRRMELAGFGRAESEQLLTGVLGAPPPPDLADQILARAGGNPLFLEQLARSGGRIPSSLRDLLLERVDRLGEPARRVTQLVAVAGAPVSHRLLAVVAGLAEGTLLAAVRSAVDGGVLGTDPDGSYRVRPELLRGALVDELLPAERVRAHRRYAETLARRPELAAVDRLAFHWTGAGEPGRAPALAPEAVADALRAGDPVRALALVDRLLAGGSAPAGWLLALRGQALHELGHPDAAAVVAEALRALPPDRSEVRAAVLDRVGRVLAARGRPEAAHLLATEAARLAAALGAPELAASARVTAASTLPPLGAYQQALTALRQERNQVTDPRLDAGLVSALTLLGRLPEAIEAGRAGGDPEVAAWLAEVLLLAGGWDEAERVAAVALERDPPRPLAVSLHAVRGEVALLRGEREIAVEQRSLAETLLERIAGAVPEALPVARLRAELALAEHRVDEARKAIAEVLPVLDECRVPLFGWQLVTTGARVESQARVRSEELARLVRGQRPPERHGAPGLGACDAGADEPLTPALRAAAAELPADTPLLAGYAAEFAAELGAGSWPEAAAGWDRVGAAYLACHARLRAAERGESSWLRTAAAAAERLGAVGLLAEIRRLAGGAGIRLADEGGGGAVSDLKRLGLTTREAEVLRLMVAGRTNRQIAQQLYISPKTASVHASRILAKLGVSNRVEAAATAHRLRLFEE